MLGAIIGHLKHLACLRWGLWVLAGAPRPLATGRPGASVWFLLGAFEAWRHSLRPQPKSRGPSLGEWDSPNGADSLTCWVYLALWVEA